MEWQLVDYFHDGRPDYHAIYNGQVVARVYSTHGAHFGLRWKWFLQWGAGPPVSGDEYSRRQAFLEVERRYVMEHGDDSEQSDHERSTVVRPSSSGQD